MTEISPTDHKAAGILFLTPDRKTLFLKRGPGGDCPGTWCFPGGSSEGGETPEQTARRETREEAGPMVPDGVLYPHTRSIQVIAQGPMAEIPGGPTLGPDNVRVVDFTTFVQRISTEFVPTLSDEHDAGLWASIDNPPTPLHPGCRVALDRFHWDELGVARAIRDGLLTSPQKYANVWLFDMRITGTGTAYRSPKYDAKGNELSPEEFVYRRPENYLTQEFLDRCNGLQVIMLHPKKMILDSKEFGARTVGAMLLPYIRAGDAEVWGIAKIYDDDAVNLLQSRQMSTSPSVLLGNGDQRMKTGDGTPIIIEGKPSLLDHLAICEQGVWDKGGEPRGVRTDAQHHGEIQMDKDELKKVLDEHIKSALPGLLSTAFAALMPDVLKAARADDAGTSTKLDAVIAGFDNLGKRIDSVAKRMDDMEKCDAFPNTRGDDDDDSYKKRMDAAEAKVKADAITGGETEVAAADRARKARMDAEESHKKAKADDDAKKKADDDAKAKKADDDAKADAARAGDKSILARLAAAEETAKNALAASQKSLTDEERGLFAGAQSRADEVFMAFGKKAPFPMNGEGIIAYRRRLASGLKEHSATWKDQDILGQAVADSAFSIAENQIYKDAALASLIPQDLPEHQLREIARVDSATNQKVITFVGRRSFVSQLKTPTRWVKSINTVRKEA